MSSLFQEEGSRSSFRKARDTIISGNSSSSSIPDTLNSSAGSGRSRTFDYNNLNAYFYPAMHMDEFHAVFLYGAL